MMEKINKTLAVIALLLLWGVTSSRAYQSNGAPSALPNATGSGPGDAVPAGRDACGKQAGLSKDTTEQRNLIVTNAKAQIQNVESDSTLSLAEQKKQIRQIRKNTRQQVGKLLTLDQQQALRQCHRDRAAASNGTATARAENATT
jgi:hypothetical protein